MMRLTKLDLSAAGEGKTCGTIIVATGFMYVVIYFLVCRQC